MRLAADALKTWASGLATTSLRSLDVEVRPLPDGELATATITDFGPDGAPDRGTVVVDPTAAGRGWFVDPSPLSGTTFGQPLSADAWRASAGSPAFGHYDLYTVLLHEEGHLLGFTDANPAFAGHLVVAAGRPVFAGPGLTVGVRGDGDHLDPVAYPDDLMDPRLAPSTRERPSAIDLEVLAAIRPPAIPAPAPIASPTRALPAASRPTPAVTSIAGPVVSGPSRAVPVATPLPYVSPASRSAASPAFVPAAGNLATPAGPTKPGTRPHPVHRSSHPVSRPAHRIAVHPHATVDPHTAKPARRLGVSHPAPAASLFPKSARRRPGP